MNQHPTTDTYAMGGSLVGRTTDQTGEKPEEELIWYEGTLTTMDRALDRNRSDAAVRNWEAAPKPVGAIIEVVERRPRPLNEDDYTNHLIAPNDVRINGQSLLAPAGYPVKIHEVVASSGDVVFCTLTLIARRVFIGHEDGEPVYARSGRRPEQPAAADESAERELADEIGAEVKRRRGEDARRRLTDLDLLADNEQSQPEAA